MKIFDVHCHIYPDKIADKASEAIGHFYDDIRMHNDGRLTTLVERLKAAGISRCCVHSVATTPKQVDSINRFVMNAANTYPDMLLPFATLHPDMENIPETVDEIVRAGFRGIKLHPEFQKFCVDEKRAIDMLAAIEGRLPLLLHCGDYRWDNSSPTRIRNLKKALPNLTLICAHFGGWTVWEQAARELPGCDVWVDTSSSLYALKPERAAEIVHSFGVDRTLYGTDYPMWDPQEEVARFMALPLTDEEREKILWSNAARFFGED